MPNTATAPQLFVLPNDIFEAISNNASDQTLLTLIDQYRNTKNNPLPAQVTPSYLRFQHYLETSMQESPLSKDIPEKDKQHKNHKTHSSVHSGAHEESEDSMHEAYSGDNNYQAIHQKVELEESAKFQKKYQKLYKRLPYQQEIDAHIHKIAEAKFKKEHPKDAKTLEQKEIFQTKAASYAHDSLGIQSLDRALQDTRQEMEKRNLTGKLKDGTITQAEYTKQANEIYNRRTLYRNIQFTQRYPDKGAYYAQTNRDLQYARTVAQYGRQQKQKKTYTAQTKKLTHAVTQTTQAIPNVPQGTLTDKTFLKQLREKLNKPLSAKEYGRQNMHGKSILDPQAVKDNEATYGSIESQNPTRGYVISPLDEDKKKKRKRPSFKDIQNTLKKLREQESAFPEEDIWQPEQFGEEPINPNEFDANPSEEGFSEIPEAFEGGEVLAPEAGEMALATSAAPEAGAAAAGTPVLVVLLILFLVIIGVVVIVLMIKHFQDQQNQGTQPIPGFTMTVDGPNQVPNGTNEVGYTINISYTGTDSIRITNPIPNNVNCAIGPGYTCNGNNDIVWNLDNLTHTQNGNAKIYTIPVTFSLQPNTKDTEINEVVTADDLTTTQNNPVPGLTLTIAAQPQVNNGNPITYTITANYQFLLGSTSYDPTVTIFSQVPPNTTLVGQPTGTNVTNNNGLFSWVLKDNAKGRDGNYQFSFTVQPNALINNTTLSNTAYATAQGTGTGATQNNIFWLNSGVSGEFPTHPEWIPGQCSQASLAEILNAYGGKKGGGWYTTEEVATISESIGVWGGVYGNLLHSNPGIGITGFKQIWDAEAAYFHFNDNYIEQQPTLANLQYILDTYVNKGYPVITSGPNHWLVIYKSDDTYVYLLDSSPNFITWADKQTNDSIQILNTPNHSYRPTKAEFVNGMKNNLFPYYWGGDANGLHPDVARTIVLTPK